MSLITNLIQKIGVDIVGQDFLLILQKVHGVFFILYYYLSGPRSLCTVHYIDWK